MHFGRIRRGQQPGPNEFRPDRIGLCLFLVLALIVPRDGHRKAESDDEGEQRQRSGQDNAEIFMLGLFQLPSPSTKVGSGVRREPQHHETECESQKRMVHHFIYIELLLL